jgi:DNA-binding response OmpR family regulator
MRFRLAVIEDNPQWREFVLRAADAVRETLGPPYSISTECFDNVGDALAALIPKTRELPPAAEQAEPPVQTIAVTDIGLPADAEDAAAILRGETAPDRRNGHRLLAELRSYRANIPVVVLTTPPHLLTDQLDACRQGVEDYDYVLKGPDRKERLVAAILRHVRRAQAHRVDLWPGPKYEARLDGVPIPLGEMPFRTFYALCQLSRGRRNVAFRLETILDQLDESFRDEYDYKRPPETAVERALVLGRQRSGRWWRPEWEMAIANAIRLWAARKEDAGGDLARAAEMFKREHFQTWKQALRLFDLYRRANPDGAWAAYAHQPVENLPPATLHQGFESVFGGLEVDRRHDYDLHNIEDHINQIRSRVHAAFNEVHRFIEPRHELLVRRPVNDEHGYRVLGEITIHQDLEYLEGDEADADDDEEVDSPLPAGDGRAVSVLVVENEPSYLERIRSLLSAAGFEVRVATNEEDAVAVARTYMPDILCLDLHIPATRSEYEENPRSGDAGGGFRAFEKIREGLPAIHAVVPTTLFNRDDLRETAARLGIPVANIVPKGESLNGADWEGHLLLTHSRLRQEILTQAVLPAPPPWLYPIIWVGRGTDWQSGRLELTVKGKPFRMQKSKQGLLLALMIKKHGEVVSYGSVDAFVEGRPVSDNTRKMWVKNLRDKIRGEWLGLTPDSPERPELEILETVEGGLVLHAFVEGLEASDDENPA